MNEQEQRIAVGEACGWSRGFNERCGYYVIDPNGIQRGHAGLEDVANELLPDYLNDLNAIHEAENILFEKNDWRMIRTYFDSLSPNIHKDDSMDEDDWKLCHATAKQRAEAFLRTLGLWKD